MTITAQKTAVAKPPAWFIAATGVLAVTILVLAVAETNLKAHYLIDQGDYVSLIGLAFVVVAGVFLFRSERLYVSLPLVIPWLLYPIITQGDQIIDNLSINPMRAICDVLLAAIFATPVFVVVLAARYGASRMGRTLDRRGGAVLAAILMTAEIYLAYLVLGTLMLVTLVVMIAGTLAYGLTAERGRSDHDPAPVPDRRRRERLALVITLVGVAVSLGAYGGYKNNSRAYQGSPSFYTDPNNPGSAYRLDRIALPSGAVSAPRSPEFVRGALTAYARTLDRLLAGYHILDRNYTHHFHNALFLRHWPLVPNYRATGLKLVDEARSLRTDADTQAAAARATLRDDDPLAALLDDVRGYVAFVFDRAPILERLSGGFEGTEAGLQHAAHLYEGESKYLGAGLWSLNEKHRRVIDAPALAPVTAEFATVSRSIYEAYAHHVVGF